MSGLPLGADFDQPASATQLRLVEPAGSIEFEIAGDPVAKGRGRIVKRGQHFGIATPEKTRRYEDVVRQRATLVFANKRPIQGAITLTIDFVRVIPASWSKVKQCHAVQGVVRACGRPDLDNLIKSVTDGLNGVAYLDDAQIVEVRARKAYGHEPKVMVRLEWQA